MKHQIDFVVFFVVGVVVVVAVNIVVVALIVVTGTNYIQLWALYVNLRLLKALVEFLW